MTDTPPTVPSRYVIHYRLVQCEHCGEATRESQFFALTFVRSRINGAPTKHLEPVRRPFYNVPVDKILTGCYKVPYCQACDAIDLSHLPPPPSEAALTDLPEPVLKTTRPVKPTGPSARPTTPPRRKPTLEELA